MKIGLMDLQFFLVRFCHSPDIERELEPTNLVIQKMIDYSKQFNIIGVFDGKRPDFRLSLLSEYKVKKTRERTPEELEKDLRVKHLIKVNRIALRKFLAHTGIPVILHPEYEADDMVYLLAKHYRNQGIDVTAITSDSDYFQMIYFGVDVFRPFHNEVVNSSEFLKKFGFSAEYYTLFLSLTGSHNSVPGVHGIGPKRATTIIKELKDPTLDCLREWSKTSNSKWASVVHDNLKIVKRNMHLIDLNYIPMSVEDAVEMLQFSLSETSFEFRNYIAQARELEIFQPARWVPDLKKLQY